MKKITFLCVLSFFTTLCLFAQAPQYYNYNTTTGPNSFPFNITQGKKIQLLFLPGDFNQPTPAPAGNIISISFMMAANLGPNTYTNLHISMGDTVGLTQWAASQWYTGLLDTVFFRATTSLTGIQGQWLTIALDSPFAYNPARNLIVEVEQCGAAPGGGFSSATTVVSSIRRNTSLANTSCPFSWGQQSTTFSNTGISLVPLGISNENTLPDEYRLEQNYPNPFNPVTTISYALPKAGIAELIVYDVLGKEVGVLVNEFRPAGKYNAVFDASELSGGLYFYTLKAVGFTDTKKMLLIK